MIKEVTQQKEDMLRYCGYVVGVLRSIGVQYSVQWFLTGNVLTMQDWEGYLPTAQAASAER